MASRASPPAAARAPPQAARGRACTGAWACGCESHRRAASWRARALGHEPSVLAHEPPQRPAGRLGRKGPQLVASRRRTRASASTSATASSRATGWRWPALRERLRLRASGCARASRRRGANGDGNRFHCSAKEPRQECGTRSPLRQRTSLPPMSAHAEARRALRVQGLPPELAKHTPFSPKLCHDRRAFQQYSL